MPLIKPWLPLSLSKKWMTMEALLLLTVVRLCVTFLPFRLWSAYLQSDGQGNKPPSAGSIAVLKAVQRASRFHPRALCLTRAITLHLLLHRYGHSAELHIGTRLKQTHLEAHAWVDQGGAILIGNLPDLSTYTPLPLGHGSGA